jgi:hypothetical protein
MNALVFKRSGHRERGKIDETETLSYLEEGNVEPVGGIRGRDSRMERGHCRDVPGSDGERGNWRYIHTREREDIFARRDRGGDGGGRAVGRAGERERGVAGRGGAGGRRG